MLSCCVSDAMQAAKQVQCSLEYTTLRKVTGATEIYYDPDPTVRATVCHLSTLLLFLVTHTSSSAFSWQSAVLHHPCRNAHFFSTKTVLPAFFRVSKNKCALWRMCLVM